MIHSQTIWKTKRVFGTGGVGGRVWPNDSAPCCAPYNILFAHCAIVAVVKGAETRKAHESTTVSSNNNKTQYLHHFRTTTSVTSEHIVTARLTLFSNPHILIATSHLQVHSREFAKYLNSLASNRVKIMDSEAGPLQVALHNSWKNIAAVYISLTIIKASVYNGPADLLESLISEITFLCGMHHSLYCIAVNLGASGLQPGTYSYPVLLHSETLGRLIRRGILTASRQEVIDMLVAVRLCRDQASRIATFGAYELQVLHDSLSGLPLPIPLDGYHVKELAPTLTGWMERLNSELSNRPLLTYGAECGIAEARGELEPGYKIAVTGWVKFARSSWPIIEASVRQLFAMPTSNNFMQWLVEYARTEWPEVYLQAVPMTKLVDDLACGFVNPLHVAAMFGLPPAGVNLVWNYSRLINMAGCFGSPLFCALVGPIAMRFRCVPPSWGQLIVQMEPAPSEVILDLIAEGASCDAMFPIEDIPTSVSVAHLGFVAATILENARIFTMMLRKRRWSCLQEDFTLMMRSSRIFEQKARENPRLMSQLMTFAFDLSMVMTADNLPWEGNVIGYCIADYMTRMELEFDVSEDLRLPHIKDVHFDRVVRQCVIADQAVIDGKAVFLERLVEDRRFNPNLPANENGNEDGTIVHSAVSGAHHAVIHELHLANADFEAVDEEGRTPLMVVEDTATLDILVLEYDISTTAKNNHGQNIWHLAAATNDASILEWLRKHDPAKAENINVVSDTGRTPLVEALLCITVFTEEEGSQLAMKPRAAKLLLDDEMVDSKLNTDLLPIRDLAARWGDLELMGKLMKAGFDV